MLKVKLGQTLTNQGLTFGTNIWMASLLICRSANVVKIDRKGEINMCVDLYTERSVSI